MPGGARRTSAVLSTGVGRAERTAWLPNWVRLLPPGLVLLALVLELTTPTRYSFASFLTAAVVLAALLTRPFVTALIGGLSIALLVGLHVALDDVYPENVVGPVVTLVLVSGFATLLAVILERTTLQLVQMNAVAEATQRALLRPLPDRVGPVRLAGLYRAADEAALIGGDFYSVRRTPYGVRAVIGDVRGKGIGATEGVATITSAFRQAAEQCATLSEVAARIEAAMALDRQDMATGGSLAAPTSGMPRSWSEELFATAVLLEFPPEGGLVRVLNRGHPPMFRICGPGGVRPLDPAPALPLGFGDLASAPAKEGPATGEAGSGQGASGQAASGDASSGHAGSGDASSGHAASGSTGEKSYELADGETLVAYSDGVTEARNRDGVFYPLEKRLAERFGDGAGARTAGGGEEPGRVEPAEIVSFLSHDVTRWAATLNDDLVILVLRHDASPHAPAAR